MKNIGTLIAVVLFLSSCSTYQMSTISSTSTKLDSTGVFRAENDSLRLTYNFKGENQPLNIEVFNKLNEPLYVNWAKSALIAGDKAYSFTGDEIKISGSTSSVSTQFTRRGDSYTDGTIKATAKVSQAESFIPPHSSITKTVYVLKDAEMAELQKADFKKTYLNYDDGSGQATGKRANYAAANSPLTFRSYLTLYTLRENQVNTFSLEDVFFVSSIVQTGVNPNDLYEFKNNKGDLIVNSRITGYGETISLK